MPVDDIETMGSADAPDAIYDARTLGTPKMVLFGLQHLFAMFGATVLVPALTGLSVQATLLFAGLGTLLFHFLAKGKVPAFLGSSFAFIAASSISAGTVSERQTASAAVPSAASRFAARQMAPQISPASRPASAAEAAGWGVI